MTPGISQAPSQWWEVVLNINEPVVNYRLIINGDDGMWSYSAGGPLAHIPLDNMDFCLLANQEFPEWLRTAVFYQIFPDRFANGDPDNDPKANEFNYNGHGPQTYSWGTPPAPDQPFPITFYGGDLLGIIDNLDYLQQLGINALYLNPIFSAYSNHKYDVTDYNNVDAHFGGDEALVELHQALERRQMRYILDIVPNHCGYWHPWFQKAQTDIQANEADFFFIIIIRTITFHGWGYGHFPNLTTIARSYVVESLKIMIPYFDAGFDLLFQRMDGALT